MLILNFRHRIKNDQLDKIKYLTGCNDINIIDVNAYIYRDHPIQAQLEDLIDSISDRVNFAVDDYLINLPSLSITAVTITAIVKRRSGRLPSVISIKPVMNNKTPEYEVNEIINLQII